MSCNSIITNCRLCKSDDIKTVISLGSQYITSRFPVYGDFSTPKTDIDLCVCQNCRLLQLLQTTLASELYEYEYGYRSGLNNTMSNHLHEYQKEILSKIDLYDNDVVVDIGSNDSTMLQFYSNKLKRIGVDPTGRQFKEFYGDVELLPDYFTLNNFKNVYGDIKCKIVSSISMFYDLPDPVQFAKDIYEILDDNGIWTCEQSYIVSMLKTNSIDTICHEHLEYYSLKQIKLIADMANFKIIDIKFNSCNGGSFRIYFSKKDSLVYTECTDLINSILNDEFNYGLYNDDIFTKFINDCDNEVNKLKNFIRYANESGKKIYIYGASTKGNCLLQYANIGENEIKYAVERNPRKFGKMTNTGIKIISEEEMRKCPPDYLLVLPWHFKNEIIMREDDFLSNGGQFIFPFPTFDIISKNQKVLITGCDGMIATHMYKELNNSSLYGITKKSVVNNNILKYTFDITDNKQLEECIMTIKPDKVIHLAGISSSKYAYENPIETLNINGLVVSNICDIIYRNKLHCKLFNASSSEMYKGHIDYEIKEDDTHHNHLHPYSIAKTMGHNMVKFYRYSYGLPFSNGILFTVESHLKNPEFLLNKIAKHIKTLSIDKKPLLVNSLDSYRIIMHADDAVSAIIKILEQNSGDDYIICGNENVSILDIVIKMYKQSGINVTKINNELIDKNTGDVLVIINNSKNGYDTVPIKIIGTPQKLYNLGWKQKYNIEGILNEILIK